MSDKETPKSSSSLESFTSRLSKIEEDLNIFFAKAGRESYISILKRINPPDALHNESVLHMAARCGNVMLMLKLLTEETIDINIKSVTNLYTPLHVATMFESIDIIELLLRFGADVNALDKNYNSSLHMAICIGNFVIIKILLKFKANPNIHNNLYNTPLSIAILDKKNFKFTKVLLEAGADINYERPCSIPLIHECILTYACCDELRFLRLLWQYGADPNTTDISGKNALHHAALKGSTKVITFLHDIGCVEDIQDYSKKTPLDIAESHGNKEAASLLKQYKAERALNNKLLNDI